MGRLYTELLSFSGKIFQCELLTDSGETVKCEVLTGSRPIVHCEVLIGCGQTLQCGVVTGSGLIVNCDVLTDSGQFVQCEILTDSGQTVQCELLTVLTVYTVKLSYALDRLEFCSGHSDTEPTDGTYICHARFNQKMTVSADSRKLSVQRLCVDQITDYCERIQVCETECLCRFIVQR